MDRNEFLRPLAELADQGQWDDAYVWFREHQEAFSRRERRLIREALAARLSVSRLWRAPALLAAGIVPVLVDPEGKCIRQLGPDAVVDAILAKRNLGTTMDMAPVVVAAGPGFTAGVDCHAVVETMRGHYLGRVIYEGSALPNTAVPGLIGGFAGERVLRAPADGLFRGVREIGETVLPGDVVGYVDSAPMACTIGGVLRGLLADGVAVHRGMKCGDVDPRCEADHCFCASDKALAVGGGVLEAILHLYTTQGKTPSFLCEQRKEAKEKL